MTQERLHQDFYSFLLFMQQDIDAPDFTHPVLCQIAPQVACEKGAARRIRACQRELAKRNGDGAALWQSLEQAAIEMDSPIVARPIWEFFTLKDAYQERPPIVYAVDGLFALPSLSVVYGAPGSFKSFIIADMCACVAGGLGWLEPFPGKEDLAPVNTKQVTTLWSDFDNGKRRTHDRMEALGRAHSLPIETPFFYVSMPSPWLDMSDADASAFLAEQIQEVKAQLVVIDNLGTVKGAVDENSGEMVQILSAFRRVAEDTGAAVVLIHHQRKTTGYGSRIGESLRGHSSIEAALDLALLVEREEHADSATLKSTKVRGADVLPFGAYLVYEHKPGTDELAHARFFGWPVEDVSSNAAIDRAILETLANEGDKMHKGDLADTVKDALDGVGINRIRDRIDHLHSEGKIVMEKGERRAKLYSLPSTTAPVFDTSNISEFIKNAPKQVAMA